MAYKKLVLLHVSGYSAAQEHQDTETVCWGDPERALLGRVPMAILKALEVRPNKIIWSGAPVVKYFATPLAEPEALALVRMADFEQLTASFPQFFDPIHFPEGTAAFNSWIEQTMVLDRESKVTEESVYWLLRYIESLNLSPDHYITLYLVSSLNHALRVAMYAAQAFHGYKVPVHIQACLAGTTYGLATPATMEVNDGVYPRTPRR